MNGHDLRRHFQELNAKYFSGRLPQYSIRVVNHMTWLGESGQCLRRRRLIEIQKGIDEPIETLLHEMIHAATNGFHSRAFAAEMQRLSQVGAPLSPADLNFLEQYPEGSSQRLSRSELRTHFQDVLVDRPDAKFRDAVRRIVWEYGLADSIADFDRKYSWAKGVFSRCKKGTREDEVRRASIATIMAKKGT